MSPGSATPHGDSPGRPTAENNQPSSNGSQHRGIPTGPIDAITATTSNQRFEEDIRLALSQEWEPNDANLGRNIEHMVENISRLSTILYRATQNYRTFNNLATAERRIDIRSTIQERLNNERLSRILQVRSSDDGALDLFRTIRTEILWAITLATEGEANQYQPVPLLENPQNWPQTIGSPPVGSTIIVSEQARTNGRFRVARRALEPHASTTAPGLVVEIPETRVLANSVDPGAESQPVILYNPCRIICRTSRLENIWTNIQAQQEKKHIRQEIESTRHGTSNSFQI